jgi:hypothetical protein
VGSILRSRQRVLLQPRPGQNAMNKPEDLIMTVLY